jgi:hypothetical protein
MSDSTYQPKMYERQGGGKITVEAGGIIDASAGTTILGPGTLTLPKIDTTGIKCLAAAGKNGAHSNGSYW